MFKKNPNRPPIVVQLKKIPNGYKVHSNDTYHLFHTKRVTRTMYRPDLIQGSNLGLESQGLAISSTIIQPPSHVTLPAFSSWFSLQSIHPIERDFFYEFFQSETPQYQFSFSTKNGKLYKYYRNTIIGMWRQNVKKCLSSTHCRRNLMGDVSSIIRIHGFLQNWGLINFPSKEHNKGLLVKKMEKLSCYICENTQDQAYHIAAIEDVLFQICNGCFQDNLYPQEIDPSQFVKVLSKNYRNVDNKIMNNAQIIKMLELLATSTSRQKDRQAWNLVQKEFPQFSREELIYNFLRIPLAYQMNANIFQNNEDVQTESAYQNKELPSIFQDYQNPLMASIAISYYKWKVQGQEDTRLQHLFSTAMRHASNLALQQQAKVQEMCKMLIQVTYSKLQSKSLFISEYEKLIVKSKESQRSIIMNNLAESLKQNVRYIQNQQQPEQLQVGLENQLYRSSAIERKANQHTYQSKEAVRAIDRTKRQQQNIQILEHSHHNNIFD